jgi:DHA1 family bicyclomycin/chloramphenicol resistance-like MFS transporter
MDHRQKNVIILILGFLAAIGPFSIDMYLPAFPSIASDLNTDISHVAYSLTSYFIGISIGQIIYGPLIDRYGRKKPLIIGTVLYILTSLGCALSPSIYWLVGLRFLLALGGCAGMVASRAVVRDLFPPGETAKVFSAILLVMGVAPIIAPTIGGYVVVALGWRAVFFVLTGISIVMLISVIKWLPESKGPDSSISMKLKGIIKDYKIVFNEPLFIIYTLTGASASAGMFAYISGSPFVFMELFGISEKHYGWLFGANAFGIIAASQINRLWLKYQLSEQIVSRVIVFLSFFGILLMVGTVLGILSQTATLILIFLYLCCLGFTYPNTTALSLFPFTKYAGSASAMIGFIQMICGAIASALVGYFHNNTAIPMTLIIGLCSLLSVSWLYGSRAILRRKMQELPTVN